MTRVEASNAVTRFTESIAQPGPYPPAQGVSHAAALNLLGEDRFAKLLRDPVRSHGPIKGYIYPWNVIDYLDEAAKLG